MAIIQNNGPYSNPNPILVLTLNPTHPINPAHPTDPKSNPNAMLSPCTQTEQTSAILELYFRFRSYLLIVTSIGILH